MAKVQPSLTQKAGAARPAAHGQTRASTEAPKAGRGGLARPVTPNPALHPIESPR